MSNNQLAGVSSESVELHQDIKVHLCSQANQKSKREALLLRDPSSNHYYWLVSNDSKDQPWSKG